MRQLTVILLCLFMSFHANAADEATQTKTTNVTDSKPAAAAEKSPVVTTAKPETLKKSTVMTASKPATTAKKAAVITASKPAAVTKKASVITASKPTVSIETSVVTASNPAVAVEITEPHTDHSKEHSEEKTAMAIETSVVTASNPAVAVEITEPHTDHSKEHSAEKTAFFSLHLINEFAPFDYLRYKRFGLSLGFGGDLFHQSAFELNIRLINPSAFFSAKYEQDFTRNYRWIPGFDASLLLGAKGNQGPRRSWDKYLAVGLEGGLYVKTFITKSYALLARTGLNYEASVNTSSLLDQEPNIYVSIGLKKYFK